MKFVQFVTGHTPSRQLVTAVAALASPFRVQRPALFAAVIHGATEQLSEDGTDHQDTHDKKNAEKRVHFFSDGEEPTSFPAAPSRSRHC